LVARGLRRQWAHSCVLTRFSIDRKAELLGGFSAAERPATCLPRRGPRARAVHARARWLARSMQLAWREFSFCDRTREGRPGILPRPANPFTEIRRGLSIIGKSLNHCFCQRRRDGDRIDRAPTPRGGTFEPQPMSKRAAIPRKIIEAACCAPFQE